MQVGLQVATRGFEIDGCEVSRLSSVSGRTIPNKTCCRDEPIKQFGQYVDKYMRGVVYGQDVRSTHFVGHSSLLIYEEV